MKETDILKIHKFVDCIEGWTAEIRAKVNNKTGEVLDEQIIMSNKVFHSKHSEL